MNQSTAIFLINDEVRALLGTYEAEDNAKRELFKTLDPTITVGDFAIVPTETRHKMTVVKIVETDVELDLDSPVMVRWVIERIDSSAHDADAAKEQEALSLIKKAQYHKKKLELRAALLGHQQEVLAGLPLASIASK